MCAMCTYDLVLLHSSLNARSHSTLAMSTERAARWTYSLHIYIESTMSIITPNESSAKCVFVHNQCSVTMIQRSNRDYKFTINCKSLILDCKLQLIDKCI